MDFSPEKKAELEKSSVIAWILLNGFVNEYNKPLEFTKHRFLLDYLADNTQVIVTKKCSQIGLTTTEALKSFHLSAYARMNTIHTLHTADVIKGFVAPKVNPIIEYNPVIKKLVKMDSESLKQIGENFIFYRGAQSESAAINITADVLLIDEYDRSNQKVAEMFASRLDASEYKWKRYFSNPSARGYGVDKLYNQSDQRHWMITCSHCGHKSYMRFEAGGDDKPHYVDIDKVIFACGKCKKEIYDKDRIGGEWVAKYPGRDWHGYWFSQLMAPWINAKEILEKQQNTSTEFFHNFVLGEAYTPTDLIINRETILNTTEPLVIPKSNVAIGVDNGATKHWVAATPAGVFDYGKTTDWKDIEKLHLMYNATMVIDAMPDFTIPKRLVEKYKGKIFINYYKQDTKNLGTVRWGEKKDYGVVYSDRTKIMDMVATEINEHKIIFRQRPDQLNDYITHWENTSRVLSIDEEKGIEKGEWTNQGPDHWAHATNYMRIALSRIVGGTIGMDFVEPETKEKLQVGYVVGGKLHTDLGEKIDQALNNDIEATDWRYV